MIVRRIGIALSAMFLASCNLFNGAGNVALRDVDGGVEYYARFPNGLPSDPSFFPIGVWFESVTTQDDVDLDKDAGLNTYVVLTSNSSLQLVAVNGMHALLQYDSWRSRAHAIGSDAIAGWLLYDEIDMQKTPATGFRMLESAMAEIPADGRVIFNNYGKGVMFTTWRTNEQAARYVNDYQDIVCADLYWFTDNDLVSFSQGGTLLGDGTHDLTFEETRRAANYGATVDRLRSLVAPRGSKPVWNFVEVGHPFTSGSSPTIQPAEVSGAVWSSIIHGARGIVYFNHSFGGAFLSQHVLRDPNYAATRTEVRKTNARIAALAPVLNSPFTDGFVRTASAVDAMAKLHRGAYYVFAGSRSPSAQTATLELLGVSTATATVLFEDRVIAVSDGRLVDEFADGNAVHIYRIDGLAP